MQAQGVRRADTRDGERRDRDERDVDEAQVEKRISGTRVREIQSRFNIAVTTDFCGDCPLG